MSQIRLRPSSKVLRLAAVLLTVSSASQAAVFNFDTDPFAGSTALETPGRQVVANELFIPNFNFSADVISFNAAVFGVGPNVGFFNGVASAVPPGGRNVIVLQDLDDGDATNGQSLNAIQSANLIAERVSQPGAGFYVYFNTGLNLNRLVYSTDLDSPTADLKIIARFTDQTGEDGIGALSQYSAANFAFVPGPAAFVPEPASIGLMVAGLAGMVLRRRADKSGSRA